jgi:hypothetical protein
MFERKFDSCDVSHKQDKEKFDVLRKKIIASNNSGAWLEVEFDFSKENNKVIQELVHLKRNTV